MNKLIRIIPVLLLVNCFIACKKEATKKPDCQFTACYIEDSLAYRNEYNAKGKTEKIIYYNNSQIDFFTAYTYTDSTVLEQSYDASGVKSGENTIYYLGDDGYVDQKVYKTSTGSSTTIYTRNNEGHLINKKLGNVEYKYTIKNGNHDSCYVYEGGGLSAVMAYEYYTDKPYTPNNTTDDIIPSGKHDENLIKKIIYNGESFDLTTEYSYEINSYGNIIKVNISNSSGENQVFDLKYKCE